MPLDKPLHQPADDPSPRQTLSKRVKPARTSFHTKWAPSNAPQKPTAQSVGQAKSQKLLPQLFQFDCTDLASGIFRIMIHKRRVFDGYIDRELPGAAISLVGRALFVRFLGVRKLLPDSCSRERMRTPLEAAIAAKTNGGSTETVDA